MIAHPQLRALRSDPAPQRAAQVALQAALARWRSEAMPDIAAELERFGAGVPLAGCPSLNALFRPGEAAARLTQDFVRKMAQALAQSPLGHVPLRHFTDGVTSTLLLQRSAQATLALVAIDGAGLSARAAARTVDFAATQTWEHVLAGEGEAELIELIGLSATRAELRRTPTALIAGEIGVRDGTRQALQIGAVPGRLVLLRLQRRLSTGEPTREYSLGEGRLVHQAAGDPGESRAELMMALLGRMQRSDAAPLIAAVALGEGSAALRWQALRECLALDTGTGFDALGRVAADPADALAAAATTLRERLLATYPQLQDAEPCLA